MLSFKYRLKEITKVTVLAKLCYTVLLLFLIFLLLNAIFPININKSYATTVVDSNGEILYSFLSKDDKWRMYTQLNEISDDLKKAIIYKEDRLFYYHYGVNPLAISRAFFNNVIKGKRTSGASTITMQVVRLLEPKPRTYANKLLEMFRATQLEWKLSKAEILQLYLNLVPYGGNIEGVKSAAVLYFNKMPNHLSLAEITALSIIPNRPSSLQIGVHNEEIEQERNKWLLRFKKDNIFDKSTIDDALSEPFIAQRIASPKIAPHLAFRLKQQYPHSTVIQTTIQKDKQLATEKLIRTYSNKLLPFNIYNTAVMVIDNKNMQVVAYVGSSNFYSNIDAGQVDGVRAVRQPGSTLKPLIYAMAFNQGSLTPKTIMTDVPINYNGYSPVNFNQEFNGYVTAENALSKSLNIPAVKALNMVSVDKVVDKLIACNFKTIEKQKDNLGLSLVLGGCGVTLEEMTTLYASFANKGKFFKPKYINQKQDAASINILNEDVVFMIDEILTKVERPDLPNSWQSAKNLPKISWKTGTSYGRRDAWSIGYNNNYTIGVWVGNFSGKGVPELTGAQMASPLLFNLFNTLEKKPNKNWLKAPEDLQFRLVCPESGLPPSQQCEHTVMDYFIPGVSSNMTCKHLQKIYVSENDSFSYCMNCLPTAGYKEKWFPNHPIEMLAYFEEHHINYTKIPKHNPQCTAFNNFNPPQIATPSNGNTYYIIKEEPEALVLSVNVASDVKKVYWYINNQFLKEADKTEKVMYLPTQSGHYKISCSDDKARNSDIEIEVKMVE